jgi:hypothetical protein
MKQALTTMIGLVALVMGVMAVAQDDAIEGEAAPYEDALDREGERCISPSVIRETHATDDETILFYMRGGKIYRNTLRYTCNGLERENRIAYSVTGNRLCNVDTIRVIQPFGGGRFCGLGLFYPITEEEADFLRYGERNEMQDEPEAVEMPESDDVEEATQSDSYGIDDYNNETDYNYEC